MHTDSRFSLTHKRTAGSAARLPIDREYALIGRWQKSADRRALGELVAAYRRLVVAAAAKYKALGIPLDDLIQEGNAALVHAANRFDVGRGCRFSTYATWWVRAAILDYVLDNRSTVRRITSGSQRSLFFQIQRFRYAWQVSGRMTPGECDRAAEELGISRQVVDEIEGFLASSDVPVLEQSELEDGKGAVILASDQPTPEEVLADQQERDSQGRWLREALTRLNERERAIILQRQLCEVPSTLSDLGRLFGISAERVRQIEQAAMSKLRRLAAVGGTEAVA